MRIIIDAMGGDNAPGEIVKGAVAARKEFGADVTLVGAREDILRCLESEGAAEGDGIEIVHAPDKITMEDDPSTAVRAKKDSSMAVGLRLLSDGGGDAMISAGSTGALLTGATLIVKRVKGIRRAALAPVLPNGAGGVILIDCGANVECTPEYLLQFAYMGSYYAKSMMGLREPKVGLLNVGTEETKGTELQKEARRLLKKAHEAGRINFVGNVEGPAVFSGKVDVLVADGFTGNIFLKSCEGVAGFLISELKKMFKSSLKTKLAAAMVMDEMKRFKSLLDVSEVGGTALLGISKPVIKAHGSSDARAIRSAVMQAVKVIEADVVGNITSNIDYMKINPEDLSV